MNNSKTDVSCMAQKKENRPCAMKILYDSLLTMEIPEDTSLV